jgi:hypothetical protein
MNLPMLRRREFFWLSALLAAAAALGIAFLPWETVGAPVLAMLVSLSLALGLALFDSPKEERRFVAWLFLAALGLRLLAAAAFYGWTGGAESFLYSDANTYDRVAWVLAQSWHTGGAVVGVQSVDFVLDDIYPKLLAGLYYFLGHSNAAAIVLNIVFGASSVYLVFRIATTLFGPLTGRRAGWLTAFYTGFWLWEMMTLKDAVFLFLILLFFLGLYRLWDLLVIPDRSPGRLLRAAGWAAVLSLIFLAAGELRSYMPIVLAGAAVSLPLAEFLAAGRPWRWLLVLGTVAALLVVFWPAVARHFLFPVAIGSQSTLFQIAEVPDTRTVGVFLEWIAAHPAGFAKYLALTLFSTALAPYAWLLPGTVPEVTRFESYMVVFPGMWMWYLLIPFFLIGVWKAVRSGNGEAWPLVVYAAAVFLVVSIFIPREFRHRDMAMPVALLLSAVGLVSGRKGWLLALIVWIPLIGFIAWKLQSVAPVLIAAAAAAAAGIVWRVQLLRKRWARTARA